MIKHSWPFNTAPTAEMKDDRIVDVYSFVKRQIGIPDEPGWFGGMKPYWADAEDAGASGSFLIPDEYKVKDTVWPNWAKPPVFASSLVCVYCGQKPSDSKRTQCYHCGAPLRRAR